MPMPCQGFTTFATAKPRGTRRAVSRDRRIFRSTISDVARRSLPAKSLAICWRAMATSRRSCRSSQARSAVRGPTMELVRGALIGCRRPATVWTGGCARSGTGNGRADARRDETQRRRDIRAPRRRQMERRRAVRRELCQRHLADARLAGFPCRRYGGGRSWRHHAGADGGAGLATPLEAVDAPIGQGVVYMFSDGRLTKYS